MQRLYQKIYLTIIVSMLLVVLVAGAIWRLGARESPAERGIRDGGRALGRRAAPPEARLEAQQAPSSDSRRGSSTDLALLRCRLRLVAAVGGAAAAAAGRGRGGWFTVPRGPAWSFPAARRALLWSSARRCATRAARSGLLLFSAGIAVAVAVWRLSDRARAHPPAGAAAGRRRDAGRRRSGGAGEGGRPRRGRAAGRQLQSLGRPHRGARERPRCCSPMPRTSCARRCRASGSAVELYTETGDPKYKAELERDIAELDQLIDEILLASRLDATRRCLRTRRSICSRSSPRNARADDCSRKGSPSPSAGIRGCCAA